MQDRMHTLNVHDSGVVVVKSLHIVQAHTRTGSDSVSDLSALPAP